MAEDQKPPAAATTTGRRTPIALPQGASKRAYQWQWLMRDGNAVAAGDVVARGSVRSYDADGVSSVQQSSSLATITQHKRPSKKRQRITHTSALLAGATLSSGQASFTAADDDDDAKLNGSKVNGGGATTNFEYAMRSAEAQTPDIAMVELNAPTSGIFRQAPRLGNSDKHDDSIIGWVEPCEHPTVVGGLCVVCGQSPLIDPDGSTPTITATSSSSSRRPSRSSVTVSGMTVSLSAAEGQRLAAFDAQRLRAQRKLSLVLDLDHTLVHATHDVRARQHCVQRDDVRTVVLPVVEEEQQYDGMGAPSSSLPPPASAITWMQHFVKLRPHVRDFLLNTLNGYEMGVYTAGTRDYAEQVVLVLARHLVGARLDAPALHQLQRQIAKLEMEIRQQQEEKVAAEENVTAAAAAAAADVTKQGELDNDDNNKATYAETASGQTEKVAGQERSKRAVTFGETTARTDRGSREKLEQLQQELEQALELETKAMEVRHRLFGSRVVSRTDVGDLGRDVKSLKRVFPCGGTMAVVVDDREDVWANAGDTTTGQDNISRPGEPPDNLLLVRPYHWKPFVGFADVNNASGEDLSTKGEPAPPPSGDENDEIDDDEQLKWTTDTLRRIHKHYYAMVDEGTNNGSSKPSVPDVIRNMRGQVLRGAEIVLSGVVPLHRQQDDHDAATTARPRPTVVRYVESLGARLVPTVTAATTHVVAAQDGTSKTLAARQVPGCFVVHVAWLMKCYWSMTRRNELAYLLGKGVALGKQQQQQQPLPSELTARPLADSTRDNTSSSSEEDDDLAAELESEMMGEQQQQQQQDDKTPLGSA